MSRSLAPCHPAARAVALFVALATPAVGQESPRASKLDLLRSAWKKRQDAVHTIDVSWHSSRWLSRAYAQSLTPPDPTAPKAAENDFVSLDARQRFVIDAAGRTRMEYAGQVPARGSGAPTPEESLEVIADGTQKALFAVGGIGFPAYYEKPMGSVVDARALPLLLALRAADPERRVIDLGGLEETGQETQLDDCKCLVFKHPRGEVWVDPARQFVPVRYLELRNGRKSRDIVIRYTPHERIGWVPLAWNSVRLMSKTGAVLESLVADGVRLEINPELPAGTFDVTLPLGTWVNKQPAKEGDPAESYLLRADGKRHVGPGEFDGSNYEQLLHSDPPPGGSGRTWWVVLGFAAVGAGAMVWLLASRSNRAPAP
jgi:hypothetical protein